MNLTRRKFLLKAGLTCTGLGLAPLKGGEPYGIFRGMAPINPGKWSKEGKFYQKLGSSVRCRICPNHCLMEPGDLGICRNRINKNGKLITIAYGNPCAVHLDPIEKKPLFHFLPGTGVFSIAAAGCNLRCLNCQNWEISQSRPDQTRNYDMFPVKVVSSAQKKNCKSIAYTYSEPITFYEYTYDTSKIAKTKGLKNVLVSNGFINRPPLLQLCEVLDGANIDLKSFDNDIYGTLNFGSLQTVLDTLITLKEKKIWFEITNLIVPTYTDKPEIIKKMCMWIKANLGPDYPLHFSRFHPLYKLTHLPQTSAGILKKARSIAQAAGLHYVYIGNLPGGGGENTTCPKCQKIIIGRKGYMILENNLNKGKCKYCGTPIAGVWET